MATNLETRATEQRDLLAGTTAAVIDTIATSRSEVGRRHDKPADVDRSDWAVQFGADQHVEVAASTLASLADAEAALRLDLSQIANPAEAETFEDQLRDNLIAQAEVHVELRSAHERKIALDARLERLAQLKTRVDAALAAAETHLGWALQRQSDADAMTTELGAPPLNDLAGRATALSGTLGPADTRLSDLLPADVRTRAGERFDEAAQVVAEAEAHLVAGLAVLDDVAADTGPFAAPVATAMRDYLSAAAALTRYISTTGPRLDTYEARIAAIAAHPALTAVQVAALDPAGDPLREESIAHEGVLATALVAARSARRAVDDAVLTEVRERPDEDPFGAVSVQDALDLLNDPTVQDPIDLARTAYDVDARLVVDKWEVEVPATLWSALMGYLQIEADLIAVASDPSAGFLADLDAASDTLATTLNDRDRALRAAFMVELTASERFARLEAVRRTMHNRHLQYLRGDGPSGRTADEL